MNQKVELITLVVHTEHHAMKLKDILEFHGINVILKPVSVKDISSEPVYEIVIPLSSLALGLKILESGEDNVTPLTLIKMTGMATSLLIPVDFSSLSMLAVKVGFYLAEKFGAEPIILHSYLTPLFEPNDSTLIDNTITEDTQELEAVESSDLRKAASRQLSKFKEKILEGQRNGVLPDIKFSTTLLAGIPEQVIQEYCKTNRPMMVVMATRGANRKESELVGSVTAEVIDATRTPVFTVPDNYVPRGLEAIKRVVMFCTFSSFDLLSLRGLMRTFDYPAVDFYLVPSSDNRIIKSDSKIEELCSYFAKLFPTAKFHATNMRSGKFDEHIRELIEKNEIQLMIVPNKKSSAFTRFFRPTLAHRILFEKDIPLLVLPV